MATNQEQIQRQMQKNNIGMATNNPQENVNQVQPINQNIQVGAPQFANQTQPPANSPSNTPGLATISSSAGNDQSSQSQQSYNVPTAVEYQPQTQTENSNIQSAFDNYKSQYSYESNLPKMKLPTAGLNTAQGQYQSRFADAMNQILEQLCNQRFSYNPNEDDLLKQSAQFASQNVYESMNSRGILNSSLTAERVTRVVGELIPTYEKMARDEFDASMSRLINVANLMMDMDTREFAQWQDAQDRKWQEEERTYQRKLDAIEQAWKRVDELGYVDNESAIVLGVQAGTLSKDAREAKEAYERQIEEWNRQHEIEKQTQIELYKLQQDLQKEMYDYEARGELDKYEKQLQIQKNYTTTSSSTGNGSSQRTTDSSGVTENYDYYDSIIKNAYAVYDDYTKQYVIPDETKYTQLRNYLGMLYDYGYINDTELTMLAAKYSNYETTGTGTGSSSSSSSSNDERILLTDDTKDLWIKALDGNNAALKKLGVTIRGQKKGMFNNKDVRNAVETALRKIKNGEYTYTSAQDLMDDLVSGNGDLFGKLGFGF